MARVSRSAWPDWPVEDPRPEDLDRSLEELVHLDAKGLGRRWRTLVGGAMPAGLGRALALRILAYHSQAQRFGDLDRASRQALAAIVGTPEHHLAEAAPGSDAKIDERSRVLLPGTMLTRKHAGVLHRVMVTEEGVSWNGRIYNSLSKVAFAITGTRWNGPRFFGLRDKADAAGSRISKRARAPEHRSVAVAAGSSPSTSP